MFMVFKLQQAQRLVHRQGISLTVASLVIRPTGSPLRAALPWGLEAQDLQEEHHQEAQPAQDLQEEQHQGVAAQEEIKQALARTMLCTLFPRKRPGLRIPT